ncbi:hypothetical protein [Escherichia phage UPEC07]|nr:hypothetical protein [Escherichia phage UPEC07]
MIFMPDEQLLWYDHKDSLEKGGQATFAQYHKNKGTRRSLFN